MSVDWIRLSLAGAALLVGCGDLGESPPPDDASATAPSCGAGSVQIDGGECALAGVPPERCGAGFASDGQRGCRAVLPEVPCADGSMAVPGDTACAEPTPCADGRWGDVSVDANTVHVDASYTGADADGTAERPFATVTDAITAAKSGSMVAVAAGSYAGDVTIGGKSLRLWGRCARLVEIVGSGVGPAAIFVQNAASGTEVHGVAIRGPQLGIGISGSKDIVVDGVWIHDTKDAGIVTRSVLGATSATIRRSLVERAGGGAGVVAAGSSLTLDHVEVRGTLPAVTGESGLGAIAQHDPEAEGRASLTILGSFIHDVLAQGISANGADLVIDATLVRSVYPQQSDMQFGRGINVESNVVSLEPSSLVITSSVVESCHHLGLFVLASEATVEATVVRDVLATEAHPNGRGMHVQSEEGDPARRGTLVVRDTLVERTVEFGMIVTNSDAIVERTAIRDTAASNGLFGDGLAVVNYGTTAKVTLIDSWVAHHSRAGVSTFASDVTVSRSRFECNAIQLAGEPSGAAYSLEDLGGNECGCAELGDDEPCQVQTSSIEPPKSL